MITMNGGKKTILNKTLVIVTIIAFAATILSGCTDTTDEVTTIKINGSSTVYPIATLCAEQFNNQNDDIVVEVGSPPIGSGGGITALGEGNVDIADASRPVKSSEEEEYSNIDFYENEVAYDGVAVIVSKTVYDAGITDLTLEELLGVYDGTYATWSELGATGLSGTGDQIAIHQREEGSGTRDTFMEAVFGDDGETIPEGVNLGGSWSSNSQLQSAVSEASNAIGYCGLGYVDDDTTPAIELGGVAPSADTIKDKSYPINRALYMYTDGAPTGAVKTFIDYVQGEGQEIVAEEGFITL